MIEEKVRELIREKLESKGFTIDSIVYEKVDNNYFLRIFINHNEGIDLDKCVEATNIISPLLDEEDFIKESYILDVSSSGKEV